MALWTARQTGKRLNNINRRWRMTVLLISPVHQARLAVTPVSRDLRPQLATSPRTSQTRKERSFAAVANGQIDPNRSLKMPKNRKT